MTDKNYELPLDIKRGTISFGGGKVQYSDRQPKNGHYGRPAIFLEGIPAVHGHKDELLNAMAWSGEQQRRVISPDRPRGRHSHGALYLYALCEFLETLKRSEREQNGFHIIGHSLGGAEAIQLVNAFIAEKSNIEAVRQYIASLTVINSAGLTQNSLVGHMMRFFRTMFATRKLQEPERTRQQEWINLCNDPRNTLQGLRDIGHIVALSRGQIARMLLRIENAGIPVLALQAEDDTLIPSRLLHPKIQSRVKVIRDWGNHLGIYSQNSEEVIRYLDTLDSPDMETAIPNTIYPEATG